MRPRKIVVLHGESVTLFAVVSYSFYDSEDWDVVATYRERAKAEKLLKIMAEEEKDEEESHGPNS